MKGFWNDLKPPGLAIWKEIHWFQKEIYWNLQEILWIQLGTHWFRKQIHWFQKEIHWSLTEIHWFFTEILWNLTEILWILTEIHWNLKEIQWISFPMASSGSFPRAFPDLRFFFVPWGGGQKSRKNEKMKIKSQEFNSKLKVFHCF